MTRRAAATIAVVSGTFVSVLGTTILTVPLHDIALDLRVPVASAALVITVPTIASATLLPIGGWLGSRFGRQRVFCIAVALVGISTLAAMFARDLATLVAMRVFQGIGSAAIVPLIMSLLSDFYEPERRAQALGAWASANSLGQALGPPLGGVLAEALGWRAALGPIPLIAGLTCAAALIYVPADEGRPVSLHWRGAALLTLGACALQVAFAAIPQLGPRAPVVGILALVGVLALTGFARSIRSAEEPFVSPQAFREPSYVTSCLGVFVATLCFGAALLAVPLYLISGLGYPTAAAGFISLALPLAMAFAAPLTSRLVNRIGAARTLLAALGMLVVGAEAVAAVVRWSLGVVPLGLFVLLIGAGIAFVYTASAVGTTQTGVGRYGAALGLFNQIRFAGAGTGAALVAIILAYAPAAHAAAFAASGAVVAAGATAILVYGRVSGYTKRRTDSPEVPV